MYQNRFQPCLSSRQDLRRGHAGEAACGRRLVIHQHFCEEWDLRRKDICNDDRGVVLEAPVSNLDRRENPSASRLHMQQHTGRSGTQTQDLTKVANGQVRLDPSRVNRESSAVAFMPVSDHKSVAFARPFL